MPDSSPALPRERRDSLTTKILLFVAVSTFVTGLAVSWVSVRSIYTSLRRDAEANLSALAQEASQRLDPWWSQARTEIETLAASRGLARRLAHRAPAGKRRRDLDTELGRLLAGSERFEALLLVGNAGEILGRAGPEEGFGPRPFRAQGSDLSARLEAVDTGDGLALAAAAPVNGRSGRPAGVLQGRVHSNAAQKALQSAVLGASGELCVVDPEGRVVLSGREPASHASRRPLRFEIPSSTPGLATVPLSDGTLALATYAPLEPGGWRVVAAQPWGEIIAPVADALRRIAFINVAIVLLFTLIAYRITGAILRPIEALYRAAHRVSEGDLEVAIPVTSSNDEIGLLTQTFNDMTRRLAKSHGEIESAYARVRDQNEELQRANEVLAQLSITDGLTKLHNHRWFQDCLTREIKRVTRSRDPLAMLLVDIDDFKQLNDRLGHAAGDELLVRIARTMNESVRETDLLARYGGEEFVVLAIGTSLAGAVALAEKVRTAVAEASFILDDSMRPCRVTVSIGVAGYRGNRREFFQAADRALYRAKAAGKNCVTEDDPEPS